MWWNMRKYWSVRKALDDTGTKERDKLLDLCSECRKVVEFRGNLLEHGHPLKVKEGVNCQYAGHLYRINRLTLEGIPNHKKVWTGPFRNLLTTAYSKHKAKSLRSKEWPFPSPFSTATSTANSKGPSPFKGSSISKTCTCDPPSCWNQITRNGHPRNLEEAPRAESLRR